jgi:NADH-quinone oxidoreductase subunit G
MIEITLDGKKVVVPEGSMVMDAASRLDTYIPHFCYHKKLSIAANCRMCLVDIEKAPKPQPACATPVTSGMVVHTRSEKALKAQRGVMEFLLINHPLDCPICDQGGECLLQDLAVGYGSSASRYSEEKRVVFHKDVGPLVGMEEMSRCIHCTRCVRFGQEIAGVMELGMLNRGEFAEITTFVGQTIDSELSGNMIDICPVGALTSKPFRYSARTWELSRRKSVSPHDGLGSNLMVQVKNERVMRVVPLENEELNECWLSDKDRFSYEGLNSPERLTRPMLKIDGRWREVEWQEALEFVAGALGSVVAEHGASALGALASPHSTLEELYLLQKLVRGLGSENIDTRLRQSDFTLDGRLAGAPWLGMSVAELSQKDSVLVIGSFLRKDHPLLAQRLRQSAKHGAQITSLHSVAADWLMPLSAQSVVAPSAWVRVLAGVAAAVAALKDVPAPIEITPDASAQALAEALLSGAHPAILLGNAAVQHPQAAQLVLLAQWLATQTGAALGILTEAANTVGAYLAGAVPTAGGLSARSQIEKPRRAYILLGLEAELDTAQPRAARAALEAADLVVMLTAFQPANLDGLDVLLPIAPFTETSGTFINAEARVQSFKGVVRPLGQTRPGWKVLRVLGNLLGLPGFEYDTSDAVRDEVTGGAATLAARCSNQVRPGLGFALPQAAARDGARLERIADVPIYFADPLVRRAASLQKTRDARAPEVRLNPAEASRLGLADGVRVRVRMGPGAALLACRIDPAVADGAARIAAAHASTQELAALHGPVEIEVLGETA